MGVELYEVENLDQLPPRPPVNAVFSVIVANREVQVSLHQNPRHVI